MHIPFLPRTIEDGLNGRAPTAWYGFNTVNGADKDWKYQRVGSLYFLINKTNELLTGIFVKRKNNGTTDDWTSVGGTGTITETVTRAQFTDGGGASGTYVLKTQLPLGAVFQRSKVINVTGFTGNTSAVLTIGDGSDVDRYNTGTPSVFTTDTSIDMGVPSGAVYHDAAQSVTLTVTGATDFTAITAGQLTVQLFYL